MKRILEKLLGILSRAILKKYQPRVIGIAGSVGKTSAKEAVFAVVAKDHRARKSIKNYNNELGVPLSIINTETGGSSPFKWLGVFARALRLLVIRDKKYPAILVQEMGVDRVGDMAYLHTIVTPEIGVLTAVAEEHLEYLKDLNGVFAEEKQILTRLPKTGRAILNFDDARARSLMEDLKAPFISYGFGEGALVRATEITIVGLEQDFCASQFEWECRDWGTQFKVTYQGNVVPMFLPHCVGAQHVTAALAGVAVGVALGMNLVTIAEGLKSYRPAPGRLNILAGIKHTLLIDDTYNSSPKAAYAALDVLDEITVPAGARKWAVLGDMRELGETSADAHRQIGFAVAERGIDYLVTVGEESRETARAAQEAGIEADRIVSFSTAEEAGRHLQAHIAEGDCILVKASRGIHLENVVKEIMADPHRAEELLVGADH